jgi:DNA repair exonuclease SbcCD ATPase subunit
MNNLTKLLIASVLSTGSHTCSCNKEKEVDPEIQKIREDGDKAIAEMRAQAEQSKRQQEEYVQKLAIEEAQKKEKHRLAVKEQKAKEKKEKGEQLQKLIERRKAVERGEKRLIKPENYFVATSRISDVQRTQGYINDLRQELVASNKAFGLTPQQQEYIQRILKRIDRLSLKLRDSIEDIQYFIEHPDPSVNYNAEKLNLATKLLKDLEQQKEELKQLVSNQGKQLDDYVEVQEPETPEEINAYRELALCLNDPTTDIEWVACTNQQVEELLDKLDKKELTSNQSENFKTQTQQLATQIREVRVRLQSKKQAVTEIYFGSDPSDYVGHSIEAGVQKIRLIEEAIDNLDELLERFWEHRIYPSIMVDSIPIISKRSLQGTLNNLVGLYQPGGGAVRAGLGSYPMPNTPATWADLALEKGLDPDVVYLGKPLQARIGSATTTLHNRVRDLLAKLFEKRMKK